MSYLCSYGFLGHDKEIPEGEAVECSKCGQHFHQECFEKHNKEKHSSKATAKLIKQVD